MILLVARMVAWNASEPRLRRRNDSAGSGAACDAEKCDEAPHFTAGSPSEKPVIAVTSVIGGHRVTGRVSDAGTAADA